MKTRAILYCLFALLQVFTQAYTQTQVFNPAIKSIKLYKFGDQPSFPELVLNSGDQLQLDFDELGKSVHAFYYDFQLRNADWSPTILTSFDYTKGFQYTRITNYRNSSIATTNYVNYQATLPDRSSAPSRSGNYLLRVYLDNDTNKLAFTKRFVVVDSRAQIAVQIQQPSNSLLFRTGQKLQVGIQVDSKINLLGPSDIRVVVLQNQSWQTALNLTQPTIYRGSYFEYSDENVTGIAGAKEFRWLDMRSLRLMSDRMLRLDNKTDSAQVYVKPEASRNGQAYIYYRDLNGAYTIESYESINPFWQGDYAFTHFKYFPPNNRPFEGSDLYLFGEMTNYATDTTGLMHFNPESGAYEKTIFLKQGYYNYLYAAKPVNGGPLDFSNTEGNYWGTENNYTVLVYYRSFGSRADELIGYTTLNSVLNR